MNENNLNVPNKKIDVVLDTDAYNEIDDQFAIAYALKSKEKLHLKALYAAPFFNARSTSPADGMLKSYEEIKKLLLLTNETTPVFKGSDRYLPDENTPVISDAAKDLVERAKGYNSKNPLYVVAIGAITNIASALLLDPTIEENIVIVWLGGHARHYHHTREFNMYQDIAAARVVMNGNEPFVQLPCLGVVDVFHVSKQQLEYYFIGKNALSDYLAKNTVAEAENYAKNRAWTRVIWDVVAIAWLLNDQNKFMNQTLVKRRLPTYEHQYEIVESEKKMAYVYHVNYDALFNDLVQKLTKQ